MFMPEKRWYNVHNFVKIYFKNFTIAAANIGVNPPKYFFRYGPGFKSIIFFQICSSDKRIVSKFRRNSIAVSTTLLVFTTTNPTAINVKLKFNCCG